MFALILYLSLPIFLAHSDGHITFVLNAMAMLFVLQLDDLGSNINGSEISVTLDYTHARDVENPGPGPEKEKPDESDETDDVSVADVPMAKEA